MWCVHFIGTLDIFNYNRMTMFEDRLWVLCMFYAEKYNSWCHFDCVHRLMIEWFACNNWEMDFLQLQCPTVADQSGWDCFNT
jgi:hypothetical protein